MPNFHRTLPNSTQQDWEEPSFLSPFDSTYNQAPCLSASEPCFFSKSDNQSFFTDSQQSTPTRSLIRHPGSFLLPKIRNQEKPLTAHKRTHPKLDLGGSPPKSLPLVGYSFPTFPQLSTCIPLATSQTETFVPQPYFIPTPHEPSPIRHEATTTLMKYFTAANPTPSLVRQLNMHIRDSNAKHFWWDIRQIRSWTSFNPATIATIPGLQALLTIALSCSSLPTPSAPRSTHPETESELHSIYSSFYTTKLNAALALAQGNRHLVMRSSTQPNQPSFISNYTDDTSELIYGRSLGRVVGLVKSFDRWNSGMRVEGNHKKVEYLRGLSHLHNCMREHGCRYGFIMTEIEMVVVRNGVENTPHFGYLEVQTIQLAAHKSEVGLQAEQEVDEEGNMIEKESKMTALLALFYLHMLARDAPLPGQVGWKTEIGAPAEGMRRKCLPKDTWMPEPQHVEKRDAMRCRGWAWPTDPIWMRKEFGKRGVKYPKMKVQGK